MFKQKIYNWLARKTEPIPKADFVDMGTVQRLRAYQQMKSPLIVKLLKARYTNNIIWQAVCPKDQIDIVRGRIRELRDLLDSIENVEESLLNIEKYTQKQKQRRSVLQNLKNKLLTNKEAKQNDLP